MNEIPNFFEKGNGEESVAPNYESLAKELSEAYTQASNGKGKERHADGSSFEQQKICVISRWVSGSPAAGPLFQAVKKAVESARLSPEAALREIDGAIVYLAAAKILIREKIQ